MSYKYIKVILFSLVFFSLSACNDNNGSDKPADTPATTPAESMSKNIPVVLVNQYPHKSSAYTEGLQYADGFMYESVGHYGQSYLYKYELATGKVVKEYKMEDQYFGEGLTIMGDKMYVLTYKEHTGMVFDKNTFKLLGTFPVRTPEGWGLTNDSTHLIYGDGTSFLYFMDPATLTEVKRMQVTDAYGPVTYINELEYINGYIYANQWETEFILKIDPNSGKVVGQADLRRVRIQAGIPENRHLEDQPEVMNGIAYDKENNRIYITGKNWPKTLEIKLDN